jgi:hypothetical protein
MRPRFRIPPLGVEGEPRTGGEEKRRLSRAGITAGSGVAGEATTLARHFLILRPSVGPATASISTGLFDTAQTDGGSMLDDACPTESARSMNLRLLLDKGGSPGCLAALVLGDGVRCITAGAHMADRDATVVEGILAVDATALRCMVLFLSWPLSRLEGVPRVFLAGVAVTAKVMGGASNAFNVSGGVDARNVLSLRKPPTPRLRGRTAGDPARGLGAKRVLSPRMPPTPRLRGRTVGDPARGAAMGGSGRFTIPRNLMTTIEGGGGGEGERMEALRDKDGAGLAPVERGPGSTV